MGFLYHLFITKVIVPLTLNWAKLGIIGLPPPPMPNLQNTVTPAITPAEKEFGEFGVAPPL